MAYLDDFTQEDRDFLVTLPYRTGLWMSLADEGGGDEAREAEQAALEALVTGFVEDYCKSEFVEELMRETLENRDIWKDWRENIETLPDECRRAVDIIAAQVQVGHVTSFKQSLMEIATAVAMAYCEFNEAEAMLVERLKVKARYFLKCLEAKKERRSKPSYSEVVNISEIEQRALKSLAVALKPDLEEGLPKSPESRAA